jgi:exodeoxyribonuclease VII small subunit
MNVSGRKPTFEESLKRLEQIVQAIEQGKVGLEESIQQFEEGMALIKQCRSVLAEAEIKIQYLQASGANGITASDAPASSPAGADPETAFGM